MAGAVMSIHYATKWECTVVEFRTLPFSTFIASKAYYAFLMAMPQRLFMFLLLKTSLLDGCLGYFETLGGKAEVRRRWYGWRFRKAGRS